MAGGMGLSPGGGTKIPHASKILHAEKKKKKEKESQSGKKILQPVQPRRASSLDYVKNSYKWVCTLTDKLNQRAEHLEIQMAKIYDNVHDLISNQGNSSWDFTTVLKKISNNVKIWYK